MSTTAGQMTILNELGIQLQSLDTTFAGTGGNTRPSKMEDWPDVEDWYALLTFSHCY
jgi:hypothetical protein